MMIYCLKNMALKIYTFVLCKTFILYTKVIGYLSVVCNFNISQGTVNRLIDFSAILFGQGVILGYFEGFTKPNPVQQEKTLFPLKKSKFKDKSGGRSSLPLRTKSLQGKGATIIFQKYERHIYYIIKLIWTISRNRNLSNKLRKKLLLKCISSK